MSRPKYINVGIVFGKDGKQLTTSRSILYPRGPRTIKALLDRMVDAINEECGTHYKVVVDKEKIVDELLP